MELPTTPSMRLDGRRALVTGASSGIGLGSAVALAEAGAHVVMAARGKDKLEQVVAAVVARGLSAESAVMDIGNIDSINAVMKSQNAFDVVVNSAGTACPTPALETTPEEYQTVMDINVRGAYFVSVGAAHGMVAAGNGGSIIHISSQMGLVGGLDRTVYSASKHAVEGMVKSMAIEWGAHNIRVNTICPCLLYTSPSPRDKRQSRMPSSA